MSNKNTYSPLRYPGGKSCLIYFLEDLLRLNKIENGTYYEFYAGGAGAAIGLLKRGTVRNIVLNDADYHIYAFWNSILRNTAEFISLVQHCNISIDNWYIQRNIYNNYEDFDELTVGFSTFFLNRCNRSGILTKAGPIGGLNQNGNYTLDARFNKRTLIDRINLIGQLSDRIEIYNEDTLVLIDNLSQEIQSPNSLTYLDPPYYNKGKSLYLNYYTHQDHANLCELLNNFRVSNWVVSYDDVREIQNLYNLFNTANIDINYSLQQKRQTKEIFIFSDNIQIPDYLLTEI